MVVTSPGLGNEYDACLHFSRGQSMTRPFTNCEASDCLSSPSALGFSHGWNRSTIFAASSVNARRMRFPRVHIRSKKEIQRLHGKTVHRRAAESGESAARHGQQHIRGRKPKL